MREEYNLKVKYNVDANATNEVKDEVIRQLSKKGGKTRKFTASEISLITC